MQLLKIKPTYLFVTGGILFAMIILSGAYFFRTNLFMEMISPKIPFQVDEQPPAPDYSDAAAWARRPQNPADIQKPAVFFVHPTTYYNGLAGWNGDINDARLNSRLNQIAIPNHAMPFAQAGELWIPYYRQATMFSLLNLSDDAKDGLNLAYSDIEAAFDAFLKAHTKQSKFILVGVNQGGLHALRLLQSKIARTDIENALAAVYLIDTIVPKNMIEKGNFGGIKICQSSMQTNCLISYNIVENIGQARHNLFKRATIWTKENGYQRDLTDAIICTNPLNGGSKDFSPAAENRGSAAASKLESGTTPAMLPAETYAKCKNGSLFVQSDRPASLKPRKFELGTFFKTTSYNLFYKNLENDSKNRMKAFKN